MYVYNRLTNFREKYSGAKSITGEDALALESAIIAYKGSYSRFVNYLA
jgi:hypothetical protein